MTVFGPEKKAMANGRCFIIDPVCAFRFGHAINSLKYFSDVARKKWNEVFKVASFHLPSSSEGPDDIERFFDFYYDKLLPIKRLPIFRNGVLVTDDNGPLQRAEKDLCDFIFLYKVTKNDAIILTNADIYTTLALALLCELYRPEQLPGIYIRFIGVMENAATQDRYLLLINRLSQLKSRGYRISISAETPTLSAKLATLMDCQVHTTPYLLPNEMHLPMPEADHFAVLCGGSARIDKGFLRLPSIIKKVLDIKGQSRRIEFRVQNLPPEDQLRHLPTVAFLYACPYVELMESTLSFDEIVDTYRQTSLSIMPYDSATYKERGSAILMESIMFGRIVAGQGGTAFSEQILKYNCGEVCNTDEQFAEAIIRLSDVPTEFLNVQISNARHRYLRDVDRAYSNWLGEAQ